MLNVFNNSEAAKPNGADARPGNGLDHAETKAAPGNQYTGPVERDDRSNMGISDNSRRKKLADVPEDQFEAALIAPPPRRPGSAKTSEQRLLAVMRERPGLTVLWLANALQTSRSATGDRLRQLARRGLVEKDAAGRWRLVEEGARREEDASRPTPPPST